MNFKLIALTALMTPAVAMLGACASMYHHGMDHGMAHASSMDSMSFHDMDKNHDGNLTKDELPASSMLYQHFSTADADGNGMLTEAEVAKHRADMAAMGK
jgi:hypothetical protein